MAVNEILKWKIVSGIFGVLFILVNIAIVAALTIPGKPFYGSPDYLKTSGESM